MQGDGREDRSDESWRTSAAIHSRTRLGWGIALFIALLFVLPVVAKLFRWF